jgi:hypothetical protein
MVPISVACRGNSWNQLIEGNLMMIRIWLILLLAVSPFALAAEQDNEGSEPNGYLARVENTSRTTGRIRELDLSTRNAVISGYNYHLGSVEGLDRCAVKVLGKEVGAVEMLQVGMFVEVHYVREPGRNSAKLIIQTEDGEEF